MRESVLRRKRFREDILKVKRWKSKRMMVMPKVMGQKRLTLKVILLLLLLLKSMTMIPTLMSQL